MVRPSRFTCGNLDDYGGIAESGTALVPYSNMDQGRLFVRVSMKDLSQLQLAYQKGLEALHRAKAKIEKLSNENQRLETMSQSWTAKTAALARESDDLRNEICDIRQLMVQTTIPVEAHDELINLLCMKICQMFSDDNVRATSKGLNFEELMNIITLLPTLLQEKLINVCPKFHDFIHNKGSDIYIRMKIQDAQATIQNILRGVPDDTELLILNSLVRDFTSRHGTPESSPSLSVRLGERDRAAVSDTECPERDRSPLRQPGPSSKIQQVASEYDIPMRDRSFTHPVSHMEESRSVCSGLGTPLAQSTPCGTMSKMVKNQVNRKVRRKPKTKRWSLATFLCSSKQPSSMSESESNDRAILARYTPARANNTKTLNAGHSRTTKPKQDKQRFHLFKWK